MGPQAWVLSPRVAETDTRTEFVRVGVGTVANRCLVRRYGHAKRFRVIPDAARPPYVMRLSMRSPTAESIDGFSTHALGEDLVDIRRAIDRLEAER